MTLATATPQKGLAKRQAIFRYLADCGGQDILTFDSASEASDAAWRLRERLPDGVSVSAQYNKVFLRAL